MKYLVPFIHLLSLLLGILCLFGCNKEDQLVDAQNIANEASAHGVEMNDSIWRIDSARTTDAGNLAWYYTNNYIFDSLEMQANELMPICERLLSYRKDSAIYHNYMRCYSALSWAQTNTGRYAEGLKNGLYSNNGLKKEFGEDYPPLLIGYVSISVNYQLQGDYDHATEYLHKSLDLMNRILPRTHPWYPLRYIRLGQNYQAKGDWETALSYFEKAIGFRKEHDKDLVIFTTQDIAGACNEAGQYHKALEFLAEAQQAWVEYPLLPVDKETKPALLAQLNLQQAYAYAGLGDWTKAEYFLEKGFSYIPNEVAKMQPMPNVNTGYWNELNQFYELQAQVMKRKGQFEASKKHYYAMIKGFSDYYGSEGHPNVLKVYKALCQMQMERNEWEKAFLTIQSVLQIQIPDFQPADHFENPMLENLGSASPILMDFLNLKARCFQLVHQRTGDQKYLEASANLYLLTMDWIKTKRGNLKGEGSKLTLSSNALATVGGGVESSLQLWEATKEPKYLQNAFHFIENSKSMALLENLRKNSVNDFLDIPSEVVAMENQLQENQAAFEKMILEENHRAKPDSLKISHWNNLVITLKDQEDSLMRVVRKKYPEYYRLKYEYSTATPKNVQTHLPENTTLLEYLLTDTLLYTFAIDKKQVRFFRQRIDASFYQNIETFRRLVHDYNPAQRRTDSEKQADFQQFVQAGRALCKTLLEPAIAIPDGNLIIIPDGALGYLPFQALLTQDVENEAVNYRTLSYAVKDFNIRYEYSATLLTQDWGKSSAPESYLGVAPHYTGEPIALRGEVDSLRFAGAFHNVRGGIPALMFNRAEVTSCAKIFDGKPLTGETASEAGFKKEAANYRILHLAMHALTNDADPLFSQLVFTQNPDDTTDDNALHAYELYNMRLNADLAVLSACNTGAGKLVRGEGIMSLSRAFKYAGCPNILMSLWSVNDASAKDIIVDFHQKLIENEGKSAALHSAQLDFLNHAPEEFAHPFYWATFVMVGNDEPLQTGMSMGWWILAAGVVGTVGGWLFLRKKYQQSLST